MKSPTVCCIVFMLLGFTQSGCSQDSSKADAPTKLSITSPQTVPPGKTVPDPAETPTSLSLRVNSLKPDANQFQIPAERKGATARMILCGPFGMDFGDERVLVGFYQNVFVGRVLEEQGPAPAGSVAFLPYTRFLVEVVENIKGDLKGHVHVDQVGGTKNGVKHEVALDGGRTAPQLIPGKTYVMATLSGEKDPTTVLKLGTHPQAYTLLDEFLTEIPTVTAFSKHPKVVKLKAAALDPIPSPFR